MIWWLTWSVLVVGTLIGAFLLGRSLWRRAVSLGHEAARSAQLAGRLADRIAELEASRPEHAWVHPLLAGPRERAAWRAGLHERRTGAARRRAASAAAAHERWETLWR